MEASLSTRPSMRGMWPRSTRLSSFLPQTPRSDFFFREVRCAGRQDSSNFNFGVDATRGRVGIEADQQTTVRGKRCVGQ